MTKRLMLFLLTLLSTSLSQIQGMNEQLLKTPGGFVISGKTHRPPERYQSDILQPDVSPLRLKFPQHFNEADLRKRLMQALERQDFDTFKKIMRSNNVDINTKRDSSKPSGYAFSTIFGEVIEDALKNRNFKLVEYLLKHGANVNSPSILDLTPLKMAVIELQALKPEDNQFLLNFISLLLDSGAIIDEESLQLVVRKSLESPFYRDVLEVFINHMSLI